MTKTELLLEVSTGLENKTQLPERPGCFGAALYMDCDVDCPFKTSCSNGNRVLFEGINLELENEELELEIETLLTSAEEAPKPEKKKREKAKTKEVAPPEVPAQEWAFGVECVQSVDTPQTELPEAPEAAPEATDAPELPDAALELFNAALEAFELPDAAPELSELPEAPEEIPTEEKPKRKTRKSKVVSEEPESVRRACGTDENILEAHLKCWSVPVAQIVNEICEQKPVRRIDAYEISRKYKTNKAEVNYMFDKVLKAMEEAGIVKLGMSGKRVILVWE